jgi:hypothetical protein
VAAPAAAPPPFAELRWIAPSAALASLTRQPATCLRFEAHDRTAVIAGQALFNSPALLGGQAAKAGLSCASCHVNGRGNPYFQMTGVSGATGTADVTHSFFSAVRGNASFDPVAIPDLAMPGKVSRDIAAGTLAPFIRTLIVEEFSGREPSQAVLDALGAYVRAVGTCASGATVTPRTLADQLQIVRGALDGATNMARRGQADAARALIAAARHQLGVIAERYQSPLFRAEQRDLLTASRALQDLSGAAGNGQELAVAATTWSARFERGLAKRLQGKESLSLYNSSNLVFVAPQQNNR